MTRPAKAHQHLLLQNALLLGSAFILILTVAVTLAFLFSYQTVTPQLKSAVTQGFQGLPADTRHDEVWFERWQTPEDLPQLVEAVALYRQGDQVAALNRHPRRALPAQAEFLPQAASVPRRQSLTPLDNDGEWALFVVTNASLMQGLYRQSLWALLGIGVFSALLAIFISNRFQRAVSSPVQHLMAVARTIDREENFSIRAEKGPDTDIGDLVDSFNAMLQRVETRDVQLKSERDRAEKAQVQAQTLAHETRDANQRLEFEVQVRAKVERKLTEFQAYLNAMINSMPSALIAVDERALITQWNDEASRLSGRALDTALGYSLDEAFPLMGQYMDRISRALLEKDIQRVERVNFEQGDREFLLDMVIYPLHLTGIIGAVIRIDDVSDKARMEEMMVQSEKMMSVGGLAAGMAHEINNPLSAIVQSAQTLRRRFSEDTQINRKVAEEIGLDMALLSQYLKRRDVDRFLDHILSSGERAASIVTNMLQFSRQSNSDRQMTGIIELIERALAIAKSDLDLRQNISHGRLVIETDWHDCAELSIPVANTEVEQVLFNLIKNAWQAISTQSSADFKGIIRIECRRTTHYCIIQVTDNGPGMDSATRKRVFEPFFTTKDVGDGTGLGLSVAYFIITSHHRGQLNVRSEPGKGTTFTIKLPLYED